MRSVGLGITMMSIENNVSNARMKPPSLPHVTRKETRSHARQASSSQLMEPVVLTESTIVGSLILLMERFVTNVSLDMEDQLIIELV